MDRETLTTQMKALKKKAQTARAAGERLAASGFNKGAARLWRKIRQLPAAVVAKVEG